MEYIRCSNCNVYLKIKNLNKHMLKMHQISMGKIETYEYIKEQKEIIKKEIENERINKKKLEKEAEENEKTEKYQKWKNEVLENIIYHKLIWDDFVFKKDKIEIKTERIKTILLPIELKGSFESLNIIKDEYFNKIYRGLFKLGFYNGELQKDLSPGWEKINNSIEKATEYYNFKYNFKKINIEHNIFEELTNIQIMNFFENSFHKSHYLKYLATIQNSEYKIIPIWEAINNTKEETFIFRLKTNKNKILVIWENANESRASHLFLISHTQDKIQLKLIQDYITRNDITTKRSLLHNSSSVFSKDIKSELNYIYHINHLNLNDYKSKIQYILKNN